MDAPEKKVAIDPKDWEKIVKYLYDTPVAFGSVERALEVKNIVSGVLWIDVIIGKDE
jgi:hypothetical protein